MASVDIKTLCPARKGDKLEDVETPSLLVDADALDANIAKCSELLRPFPTVSLRPHFKSHKSASLARYQIAEHRKHGTSINGFCAQKVCEAEALVAGGVLDVFVSNQVVGASKIRRMVALAAIPGTTISVVVDNAENASEISKAAVDAGVSLGMLVEMDVGQCRCGVPGPPEAAALAEVVRSLPGVEFRGLQAYHGSAQHIRSMDDRRAVIEKVVEKVRAALALIGECPIVTGGGTGTFDIEATHSVYNECQPGSYLFNDVDYSRNLLEDGELEAGRKWHHSLFLYSTVMSLWPGQNRAVLDAGLKCMSVDSGLPTIAGRTDLKLTGVADEHAIVKQEEPVETCTLPPLGTKLKLIPGHCDPTNNIHDFIVLYRGDVVEDVWRVDARGPGY